MTLLLKTEYFMDEGMLSRFKPRILKKIQKQAFHDAMLRWHREILPTHFRRRAYDKYRSAYGRKKKKGRPMVSSGQMEASINVTFSVSGTAKKAVGRYSMGRPFTLSAKQIRSRAFAKVKKLHVSFKQAERLAFAEQGSYKKNKLQFEIQISAFTEKDSDEMSEWVAQDIRKAFAIKGNLKKVKGRGR